MKLVFVRHGKAENITPGMEDADRRLTSGGSKELKKSMSGLKSLIGDQRNIRLWSSPLLRAMQSARIIADAFGIKEPEIHDFISSGDFPSLATELAKMDSASNDASTPLPDYLIIVGHQPQLSAWCQTICGNAMPFEKGGAVGIDLLSLSPPAGTVEWTMDPQKAKSKEINRSMPVLSELTKILRPGLQNGKEDSNPMPEMNRSKPALSELIKILQYYLQEIQNAQNKFLEEPEEIENLHQIRVNIRKFRSLLSFIRPLLSPEDYPINQEKMRKAGQLFSYLRELDVLQDEWNQIVSKQRIEIPNPSKLSGILTEMRDKEKTKLQNLLAEGVLTTALLESWSWLSDVCTGPDAKSEKTLKTYADQMIKKWKNEIRKELMEIETFDLPRIHLLRIKSKKLRYIQEIFVKKNSDNRNSRYTAKMKDLQERLGILCDTGRNIEMIHRLFSTNKSPGVPFERNIFIGYLLGKEAGSHLSSNLSNLI